MTRYLYEDLCGPMAVGIDSPPDLQWMTLTAGSSYSLILDTLIEFREDNIMPF